MKSQQGLWFPVILRLNLPSWNILPVADFCQMRGKKKQNLKVENYVLFGGLFEDSNQEDSLSAPSNNHKEVREEPGAFATKNRGSEHLKKILLIKTRHLKLMNDCFSLYEKMQESGLTELIPLIGTLPSWTSILLFSILNPLSMHSCGWLLWLMA